MSTEIAFDVECIECNWRIEKARASELGLLVAEHCRLFPDHTDFEMEVAQS